MKPLMQLKEDTTNEHKIKAVALATAFYASIYFDTVRDLRLHRNAGNG